MQDIGTYFADYDAYHKTKGNKLTHVLGIPMIILSLLGMLNQIVLVDWDFPIKASPAIALWVFGIIFYLKLHFKLGLSMAFTTAALFYAGVVLPFWANVALFVLGWVFQGIGHVVYEKKKPAFLKNLTHLFVGPAYIQNYFFRIVQ